MGDDQRPSHNPGDGWVSCRCGHQHWGLHGAAGLFVIRRREEHIDVLLQHRAAWSHQGGTWGVPGGAVATGETPLQGALREAREEAGVIQGDVQVIGGLVLDHTDWRYSTFLAVVRPGRDIAAVATDAESQEMRWTPLARVASLPLLPAFAEQLPLYRAALRRALGRSLLPR